MSQRPERGSDAMASPAGLLHAARRQFFGNGADPRGLIPDMIARSWQRSQEIGASADDGAEPVPQSELQRRRDERGRLRQHALPELDALAEALDPRPVVVLLADPEGMILDATGSDAFMNRAQRVALLPGVDWSEARRGTNAIGTAIAENGPVTVLGAQHYLEQNGFLGCTSAPLFGFDGRTLGILDVSGDPRCIPGMTGLVRMAAQMIEHRIALDGLPAHTDVLRFARDPALIGSYREALLWIRHDTVVGANRAALRALGMTFDQLRGRDVTELFDSLGDTSRQQFPLALQSWLVRPGFSTTWGASWLRADRKAAAPLATAVEAAPPPAPLVVAGGPRMPAPRTPVVGGVERERQLDRAVRVLDHGIPVLVCGESGVGKEVFARQVHERSARRNGPFVAVNCAAMPEGLIESELFGYEEGAFTGAKRKGSAGLIREADGGVLFLDEIGDMPLSLQARLLRVLQDHEVRPLGTAQAHHVDFVLMCATHRDLGAMADAGTFRTDLYFRLQHFTVELPALRDLPDAADRIDQLLSAVFPDADAVLSAQAREALCGYSWPGNWRQVVAASQTLAALVPLDGRIELADLPPAIRRHWQARSARRPVEVERAAVDAPARAPAAGDDRVSLRELTAAAIDEAIAACEGNISRAARQLGVHRSTLYRHGTGGRDRR